MSRGCVLHVAALPFPSYQGTQAAIRAMLEASTRAGRRAELFTYATAGYPLTTRFVVHRTGALPRVRSLRSGPSLGKLLLDLRMLCELQSLVRRLRPSAIIAHHVEAAALALALPRVPSVFFAHTDLAAELPSYAPTPHRAWLSWAGARVDRSLAGRADAVATISRTLSERMEPARALRNAPIYVPTPWRVPDPISSAERRAARRALGLAADSCVALYAGNLDAYQDPGAVLDALHALSAVHRIHLLIATHSEPSAFLRRAALLGVPCRATTLGDEAVRRRIHAAADLAIVPRAIPGGLPIKLLDALSRGLPCAVSPHAVAGLALTDSVVCARATGCSALAESVAALASAAGLRETLSERGRDYVSREHSDAAFLTSLDRVLALAIAQRRTCPAAWGNPLKLRARASTHSTSRAPGTIASAMSKPKLTYFDAPASRGEECRLALHIAGVPFDDNRIQRDAWAALKPTTPFGSLPVFEQAGQPALAQSNAILMLIGRQHGLHPQDLLEAARHEALMCQVEDLRAQVTPSLRISDPAEKKTAREALAAGYLPSWGQFTERQLGAGPFVAGAKLHVADIKLYMAVRWFASGNVDHVPATIFADCPKLTRLYEAVRDDARVKAWYAKA